MKNIFFIFVLMFSGVSYGANWAYVAYSESGDVFYLDVSHYKYDNRTSSVDVWVRVDSKTGINSNLAKMLDIEPSEKTYTHSKSLNRYSCSNKNVKALASVSYDPNGRVLNSASKPNSNFTIIFPDSVDEVIWTAVCSQKGKGIILPKYKPEFVDLEKVGIKAP